MRLHVINLTLFQFILSIMKKIFISLALLAGVALVGCNKNLEGPVVPEGRSARVSINLKGANVGATKANGLPVAADEIMVNTVDAFVFNSTGDLDAYRHYVSSEFTTSGSVTTLNEGNELECTTGAGKIVYIVINGNDSNLDAGEVVFANIKNEGELKARIFKLEDNFINEGDPTPVAVKKNFQMIGKTADQTFRAGNNDVDVTVYRSVARVVIKKITKNFTSAGLQGDLKIRNIYMENVVGRYGFGNVVDGDYKFDASSIAATYPAANWYYKYVPGTPAVPDDPSTPDDESVPAVLPVVDKEGAQSAYDLWLNSGFASAVTISEDDPHEADVASTFYVMPNDVPWGYDFDDDSDPATPAVKVFGPQGGTPWSPRHTKLVIETTYGDNPTVYYYSIPIADNGGVYPLGRGEKGTSGEPGYIAADDGSGYQGIKANYSYEINELVLTRLGSTNPDEPTVDAYVNFNITVAPWTITALETETGKYVI